MDSKDIEGLSSAFTGHCSLHGVPTFLGVDNDPAQVLLLSQAQVCFQLRSHLLKQYSIEHEIAPAGEHFRQGAVEARMKAFKHLAGSLDLTRSNITTLALQTFVTQVAAILNLTPLGVSIRNAASPALNVLTPNHFQTFNHTRRNLVGSVTVGGILDG